MNLKEELQKEHKESIDQFDEEVKVLYSIVEDIRRKDIISLEKNLTSLLIDASRISVAKQVAEVSFWQENETLRGVDPLLTKWKDYQSSL